MEKQKNQIHINFQEEFRSPQKNPKETSQFYLIPAQSNSVSDGKINGNAINEEESNTKRTIGNLLYYWLIVLCTAAIPIINLLLFFVQPYELANVTKASLQIQGLGRSQDFTYFFIVMGIYLGITFVFVFYTCFFTSFCQRVKLFLLVDNILITMLAADVAYGALHVVGFTAVYSTDDQSNLQADYQVLWEDAIVIALYCLTNLAYTGVFRVLMSNIYWKPWQTVVYKLAIAISSLAYVVMGLVYIFGYDSLSKLVEDFDKDLQEVFNYLYASNSASERGQIPYYQRMQDSLTDSRSMISNFIIFYVFTNFAFSFEIIAKLSDFDGTAELKTHYKFEEPQSQLDNQAQNQ